MSALVTAQQYSWLYILYIPSFLSSIHFCHLVHKHMLGVHKLLFQPNMRFYSSLMTSHHFVPIAIATSGIFSSEAITFFKELGQLHGIWRPPHSFLFTVVNTHLVMSTMSPCSLPQKSEPNTIKMSTVITNLWPYLHCSPCTLHILKLKMCMIV